MDLPRRVTALETRAGLAADAGGLIPVDAIVRVLQILDGGDRDVRELARFDGALVDACRRELARIDSGELEAER